MPSYDQMSKEHTKRGRLPGYVEAYGAFNPNRAWMWDQLQHLPPPPSEDDEEGERIGLTIPVKTRAAGQNIASNIHSFQSQFGYRFSTRTWENPDEETNEEYPWVLYVWRRD